VQVRPDDALADADALLRHMGEPFAFPSAIASRRMYRLAGEHVTVVLTGDGADEIFGGYRRYETFRALPHAADVGEDDPAARYARVLVDGLRPAVKEHLYAARFRAGLAEPDSAVLLGRRFARADSARSDLERALQVDFGFWLPDAQLVKIDRMSMASSVEARSPMLDRRLVEYVATLGPGLRLLPGQEKELLKAVAERYLPLSVVRRRKQELAVPLEVWLTRHLRADIAATLLAEPSLDRGYFHPDRLRAFVLRFRPEDAYALWTLYMLERWHQTTHTPAAAGPACCLLRGTA
jgi:asparagine synthetase B (glutamine-hydrolysing)